MLEFNQNHKSINGSLKNNKTKLKVKNIVLAGLTITSLCLFSGCAKPIECDIQENHAHSYVSSDSFDRYVVSEKEYIGVFDKWFRTDDYVIVDKETESLLEFINKEGLFQISDNQQKIDNITSLQNDYTEYRYNYTETTYIIIGDRRQPVITEKHSWTPNPSRTGLTGEERLVHHMYYGYKIITNEKGNFEIIKSDLVDNLHDLPEEYNYIKKDFFVKVDAYNKGIIFNYEDGPQHESDRIELEQYQTELNDNTKSK